MWIELYGIQTNSKNHERHILLQFESPHFVCLCISLIEGAKGIFQREIRRNIKTSTQ